MRLTPPQPTPTLSLSDIDGHPIRIGDGRKLLLSVFREAACPFCNVRVYELTHDHDDLRARGLDIVAVFHSDERDVRRFIARQPRPFRMVADPAGRAHEAFRTERSTFGKFRAVLLRLPALLKGLRLLGFAQGGRRTGALMPADFLIDGSGRIVATHYGRDAGDHMPMARILQFAGGDGLSR